MDKLNVSAIRRRSIHLLSFSQKRQVLRSADSRSSNIPPTPLCLSFPPVPPPPPPLACSTGRMQMNARLFSRQATMRALKKGSAAKGALEPPNVNEMGPFFFFGLHNDPSFCAMLSEKRSVSCHKAEHQHENSNSGQ